MTREQFVAKAVRQAERELSLPVGWWGESVNEFYSPGGAKIWGYGSVWSVRANGRLLGKYDSRAAAIRAAKKLEARP